VIFTASNLLLAALIMTESSNNDKAVNGDAWGCLQQKSIYVAEVNRILGKQVYSHKDSFNRAKAIEIFNVWNSHYIPLIEKQTGQKITSWDIAVAQKSGFEGWKSEYAKNQAQRNANAYWLKIVDAINQITTGGKS